MAASKSDLILHPVRMRVLLELAREQQTVRQLAAGLPDVAQATLYRHLNTLVQGGVLAVVEERLVRGTLERTYALAEQGARLNAEDLAALGKDDHLRHFTMFVTSLLSDFSRYLERTAEVDFEADGVGYYKAQFYLNDNELRTLQAAMQALVVPLQAHQPAEGRHRHLVSAVLLPMPESLAQDVDAEGEQTDESVR